MKNDHLNHHDKKKLPPSHPSLNHLSLDSLPAEESYLNSFIDSALPSKKDRDRKRLQRQITPLSVQSEPVSYPSIDETKTGGGDQGIRLTFSKFLYDFIKIDPNSGINIVRITQGLVDKKGIHYDHPGFYLLCYVFDGTGTISIKDKEIEAKQYDCFVIDKYHFKSIRSNHDLPLDCAFIRVQDTIQSLYLNTLIKSVNVNGYLKLVYGSGSRFRSLLWQILGQLSDQEKQSESTYARLLMGLLLELEISVITSPIRERDLPLHLQEIKKYIEKNYKEDISLDLLSKEFNVSKYHMSREFKRYIGQSPIEYLIEIRMQGAKALLIETDHTIAEIAYEVGINSPNHLLYLFKSRENTTPSDFRKQFYNRLD